MVVRPHEFRGKWILLLFLPSLLLSIPVIAGIEFTPLESWAHIKTHWTEFNVLIRFLGVLFVTLISLLLLAIPYNFRNTSADYTWIRNTTILAQGISLMMYGQVFTTSGIFFYLHSLWTAIVAIYFTYYELFVRIMPTAIPRKKDRPQPLTEQDIQSEPSSKPADLWKSISLQMDNYEIWRDPDASADSMSRLLGTNRIYLADCIREHTGLTFNDFINNKRSNFMAQELRKSPLQDQKPLYFNAGFRSRQTAYRNFVKFIGCSPTEFVQSLQS